MRKGVLANDCFIILHRKAGNSGHTAADCHDLGGINPGLVRHDIIAHFQRHHHFFQRSIACTFPQAIDRAFNLPRACLHRCQRIGGRHAKVVVAMGGKDDAIGTRHPFEQHADQVRTFTRRGIANCIGNVDRGRPRLDRDFHGPAQIVMFRARGIHRRPLHVVAQIAGVCHGLMDTLRHLVHVQFWNGAVQR